MRAAGHQQRRADIDPEQPRHGHIGRDGIDMEIDLGQLDAAQSRELAEQRRMRGVEARQPASQLFRHERIVERERLRVDAPQAPAQRVALMEAVRRGVLVIQSSRAGSGRVVQRGEDRSAGFVPADNLNPQKARVLAMLALSCTRDGEMIRGMFEEY